MTPTSVQRERYEIAIREALEYIDTPEERVIARLCFEALAKAEGLSLREVIDITLLD